MDYDIDEVVRVVARKRIEIYIQKLGFQENGLRYR